MLPAWAIVPQSLPQEAGHSCWYRVRPGASNQAVSCELELKLSADWKMGTLSIAGIVYWLDMLSPAVIRVDRIAQMYRHHQGL